VSEYPKTKTDKEVQYLLADGSRRARKLKLEPLTTAQRDALDVPNDGVIVFNSTTDRYEKRYNAAWEPLSSLMVWKDASESALSLTSKTTDVAYTDLDLTATTSANAKVAYVQLYLYVNTVSAGGMAVLAVRKNGTTPDNAPAILVSTTKGDAAGAVAVGCVWVGCDSGQVIEYLLDITGTINVDASIRVLAYME
jgi:hypothetical protein